MSVREEENVIKENAIVMKVSRVKIVAIKSVQEIALGMENAMRGYVSVIKALLGKSVKKQR